VKDEGVAFDSMFGRRLYQETEGLPFFLVEYLAALEGQTGKSQIPISNLQSPQPATLDPQPFWPMPTRVRDLLHSRLAAVSETGWQLLNTAAVIGRSFDFDTLREASGRSEEETINALEELLARRLIEEISHPIRYPSSVIRYPLSVTILTTKSYEASSMKKRAWPAAACCTGGWRKAWPLVAASDLT
jgi:predicted ATPase